MKARWVLLLALVALPVLAWAQNNRREIGSSILDRGDGGVAAPKFVRAPESRAAAPPVFIGRMWNAYSPQSAWTNLISYDPFANLAAIVHRTDRTGAGSGEIVYQISDDGGASWSRQIGPINAPGFVAGRHPNLLIANPSQSNDPSQTAAAVTYNDLTAFNAFGDVWYVTDNYLGYPSFFARDSSSRVFSYAGATDLNNGDCYFALSVNNIQAFAVSKVSRAGTLLSPKVVLAPPAEVITENGAAIEVGLDGTVHWVGRARWRMSAGAPDENKFYWRYQRSTDGGNTWSAPEYVGPQVAGRHDSNYEFDIIVDASNQVHIAALLVDSLAATGSGVGLYDLVRSTSGIWHGIMVTEIRVPEFIPPAYAASSIGDLNAPEFAKTKDGMNLALKWIDIIPNPVTREDSTIQDVFIASQALGGAWTAPRNVSNSPNVREIFTNLAPIMSDNGQLFSFYISPSMPGTDDLSEHDIFFLPDAKVPLAKATLAMPDTLTATPGSIVNIPITLALAGDSVAALGTAITATNQLLAFSGFAPGPIIPGERFNINAATPDSILLAYTDFGGGPIRKDGVLATLQFRVTPAAEGGNIAKLNFSEVFATDPQFRNLPIRPVSGQVTIVIPPVTISIADTLSGAPGDTVAVPVMLARNEHRIDALGAAIKATNRLLSYTGFVEGAIIPGAQLNVNAPAPDSVRLAYLNFSSGPIANDGVLTTLFFRIDPSAKNGDTSVLAFRDLTASDPTFQKLPIQSISGKVTVVIRPAEIRGMKWNDLNGNGRKDSNEPGLKGWEIKLTGAASQSTTTDSLGNYVFMALAPGTYTVAEILQTGWQQTFPPAPGTYMADLKSGQTLDSLNFGNWMPGSIQGMLWHDKNLDGKKNDDESLLEGWQINLAGPDTLNTTTDAAGNYRFENLAPGTYRISEILRPRWRQTFPVAPDTEYVVILASGQHVRDLNFANEPPVSAGQEKELVLPKNFVLFQNYPNPFNPSTTIKYGVPRQSRVRLEVINALGMRVAILTDEVHQPGYYEVKFDMAGLPGGIYFYRLTAAGLVETRKLLLLK